MKHTYKEGSVKKEITKNSPYTVVANSDGTYSVAKVAAVGDNEYTTLEEALSVASGNEVQLLTDITLGSEALSFTPAVTLDLNGHKLSSNGTITVSGALTLKDSSSDGSGAVEASELKFTASGASITSGAYKCKISVAESGGLAVSGGYFSQTLDSSYVATGKVVTTTDTDEKAGYSYKVTDKPEEIIAEAVAEGKTSGSVSDSIADEQAKAAAKAVAESIEAPGIAAVATDELKEEEDKETIKQEFESVKNSITISEGQEVKLYAEAYLAVKAESYTVGSTDKTMKFDIQPKVKYVASTESDVNKRNEGNTKDVCSAKDIDITVPLEMSIELPSGFAVTDDSITSTYKPVYVEHIKDHTVYRYTATVTTNNGKQIATFTNPHGFSEFTVTTVANGVSVGTQTFSSIESAIESVQDNSTATITLLDDVAADTSAIEIPANKNITLDLNGYTIGKNITNNGSLTITDTTGSGQITGTVTNNKNTTISGGTVATVNTGVDATTTVNGGTVTNLKAKENGTANVKTGGTVTNLTTEANGTANVNGGTVANISSNGRVYIYGGSITGSINNSAETGKVYAYGGTFTAANGGSVTVPSGYYYDESTSTVKAIPTPSVSTNNYLSGLTISQGTLTPAFDRNTTAYTAEVEYTTDSITVTPVKESTWASLAVNGKTITSGTASEAIALKEGANTITVRVTAESGATKDYTVTVTRKAGPGEEYTKLQKAAADYEAYKNEGYTESTWTAFETALKEAQEALKDTALSEEKAKELHEKLDAAASGLVLVETPQIESVTVSGNKASVKLTGATENAEGYDYVIGEKGCITAGKYADVLKNKGTSTKFSYVQEGTYYAYCHAWKKVDGKKVFSGWSEGYEFEVEATTVAAPKITSVKVKGKTVTITVKNAKGTAGIDTVLGKTILKDQYGKYPSGYGKLVIKNKKTTTIIFKNVPKGTYYAGTHAFTRFGSTNTKVFSKWSNIKKVVVK